MIQVKSEKTHIRRKVTFTFQCPGAGKVCLMGDFNNWDAKKHPMKKDVNGLWKKAVILAPGTYQYKFLADSQWKQDPLNDQRCGNLFGTQNNVIVVD